MTDTTDKELLEKTSSGTPGRTSAASPQKGETKATTKKTTARKKTSADTKNDAADSGAAGEDASMGIGPTAQDNRDQPGRTKTASASEPGERPGAVESPKDAPGTRSGEEARRPGAQRPRPRYDQKSDRADHKYYQRKKFKPKQPYQKHKKNRKYQPRGRSDYFDQDVETGVNIGGLLTLDICKDFEALKACAKEVSGGGEPILLNTLFEVSMQQLVEEARALEVVSDSAPNRIGLLKEIISVSFDRKIPVRVKGLLELKEEGYGLIVYEHENYRVRPLNAFVPEVFIKRFGLLRGQVIEAQIHPQGDLSNTPFVLSIESVMGLKPADNLKIEPFEDLVPYYPLERILLETNADVPWDNLSMRVIDLLTPIGFGQRGLIVAAPRTGKTVLQQGIARAIQTNNPDAHLIVLLIDERPEEVTDFRRQVTSEVISSTFDESPESHVHAAEMVIEKARRMVEAKEHVIILLDSITRLGRAYNALMPSSGKILSGGIEASALQKPKRFFGSARNIEGGGSLTIIATALVETGSRMDEVIFEEFKGTGNMELHLDRALVDKRIFPSIAMDKSGTRKEELLYHPEELTKIYSLRRAMKGVPSTEGMEMLIQRVRKTKTNAEFLMGINR